MDESRKKTVYFPWRLFLGGFLIIGGCAILITQWSGILVYWPFIVPGLLLISGLLSMTDYLLHANYRSLFMGVLLCLISLFIWTHLFLTPSLPFWENQYWLSYMFAVIGISFFLFILESKERGFAWIAYLCIGISLVQWLLQTRYLKSLQWISYLAIGLVLIGFLLISLSRRTAKKE